jgi:hypothetical protein
MLRTDATPETSGVDPSAELASRAELMAPSPEPIAPANPTVNTAPEVVEAPPVPEIAPAPAPEPAPSWPEAREAREDEPSGFHSTDPVDPWGGLTNGGRPSISSGASGSVSSVWDDPGPATQPVQSLAELESGGDSFLDQLRRAVDDDLEDDGAMTAFFDQDDDDRPKSRFGRRR